MLRVWLVVTYVGRGSFPQQGLRPVLSAEQARIRTMWDRAFVFRVRIL